MRLRLQRASSNGKSSSRSLEERVFFKDAENNCPTFLPAFSLLDEFKQ